MAEQDRQGRQPSPLLLKTCQTCFNAKIRCTKTQESGLCDRCLRLDKPCEFKPARRNHVRQGRKNVIEHRSRTSSKSPGDVIEVSGPAFNSPSVSVVDNAPSNPFASGLLTLDEGEKLLDYYRTKMTPHFPFVIIPKRKAVGELAKDRPGLSLAALAAAAHSNLQLQRSLNKVFNNLIATRLLKGSFGTIDLLQGLIIHAAWGHYQTRPRKYTQYLHLATSIISDLRVDKPRKPSLWSVEGGKERDSPDWGVEEMRALAGAYYLTSSTSVLMNKSRHFIYTPYILHCCRRVAENADVATDAHIPYIIQLQRLTEEIDDIWSNASDKLTKQHLGERSRQIRAKCEEVKLSLPFAMNESLPILMQTTLIELFLSQLSPGGDPFGVDKFDTTPLSHNPPQSGLIDWLSNSISASKSLISIILVLPPGEEAAISNIAFIILYCALSLAARLDLTAAKTQSTQFLQRFLDLPQTLRQVCMRLEAASGQDVDERGDRNAFYHLSLRARHLEKWYLKQKSEQRTAVATDSHPGAWPTTGDAPLLGMSSNPFLDSGMDFGMGSVLFSDTLAFPIDFEIENAGMWDGDLHGD